MKYQNLVEKLSERTKYTKREVRSFLETLVDVIRDELREGRDVQIWGIGWLRNKPQASRVGRHWRTGERLEIPATRRVMLEPVDALKEDVRASQEHFENTNLKKRFGLKGDD